MKKIIGSIIVMIALSITACNSNKSGTETNAETSTTMKVSEAVAFVKEAETNKGKEVTVTGYSWGNSETTDGTLNLNMGDVKLEGFQQATFYASISADKKEEAKKIAKDQMVTVKGTINSSPYATFIENCEIVEVK